MVVRGTDGSTTAAGAVLAGRCASSLGAAVATANAAPVPLRNFRREIFFRFLFLLMVHLLYVRLSGMTRICCCRYSPPKLGGEHARHTLTDRSEERRVGKECRSRWS